MYTALVLHPESQTRLQAQFQDLIPPEWTKYCHHMTINMGKVVEGPIDGSDFKLGDDAVMTVLKYAYDDKVMAVEVETSVPSQNKVKHITLAVNTKAGGKPFLSNKLSNWQSTSPLTLNGTIEELK